MRRIKDQPSRNDSANGSHNGTHHGPRPTVTTAANGTAPEAAGGRGPNGRFSAGNAFSAGNPFQRQLAARRRALLAAVTDEDIRAVGKKLVELALGGDVAAAKVLLPFLLGKPSKPVDP